MIPRILNKKFIITGFLISLSMFVSFFMGLYFLRLYSNLFGGELASIYLCEPRTRMWKADSTIAYVNKSYLNLSAIGGIRGYTDALGFRTEKEKSTFHIGTNPLKIFGIGDSVMWGTRVNQDESLLGILKNIFKEKNINAHITNAGVVGYSTYQEYLFLKKFVLPLKPAIVLINFCYNDWLPTEDPFFLKEEIYKKYFSYLLQNKDYSFNKNEKNLLEKLKRAGIGWKDIHNSNKNRIQKNFLFKILIEIPILHINSLSKKYNFDLVYLLIPDTITSKEQLHIKANLQSIFKKNKIKFLDLMNPLKEEKNVYRSNVFSFKGFIIKMFRRSKIPQLLNILHLDNLNPIASLNRISGKKDIETLKKKLPVYHLKRNYIDTIGHPSKKGNKIIAKEIYNFLSKEYSYRLKQAIYDNKKFTKE